MKPLIVLPWNSRIEEFLFLKNSSRTGIAPVFGKPACNDVFEGRSGFYEIL